MFHYPIVEQLVEQTHQTICGRPVQLGAASRFTPAPSIQFATQTFEPKGIENDS
jgi:hypothetical protein